MRIRGTWSSRGGGWWGRTRGWRARFACFTRISRSFPTCWRRWGWGGGGGAGGVGGGFRGFHASCGEFSEGGGGGGVGKVDGILADLGVSTNQLLEAEYGMSFSADMPLDMRIDPRIGESAADV